MKIAYSILFLLLLSCETSKEITDIELFEFSYEDEVSSFSIKFNETDTLLVKQHYSSEEGKEGSFYILVTEDDKSQLLELINNANISQLDSIYQEDFEDGTTLNFYVESHKSKKSIYIRLLEDEDYPKGILKLTDWLVQLKKNSALKPYWINIEFNDLSRFVIPPPPPPGLID
jgi:hypothetical protein